MITITISGPQGCGKTRMAKLLANIISYLGNNICVQDLEENFLGSIVPEGTDILIRTIQEAPAFKKSKKFTIPTEGKLVYSCILGGGPKSKKGC